MALATGVEKTAASAVPLTSATLRSTLEDAVPNDGCGSADDLMIRCRQLSTAVLLIVFLAGPAVAQNNAWWQAGAAKTNITPRRFMPMAGYASRGANHAQEELTDLHAKALMLQDAGGRRALMVTLDVIGVDRGLSFSVCDELRRRYGLKRDQIALFASHTHTGPVVAKNLRPMHYMLLNEADRQLVDDYAELLQKQIVAVAGEAIKDLAPAQLSWGSGTATFAVNRRNNPAARVPQLRKEGKLRGPHDHDVPVLAVKDADGKLKAVVFGYACHCTVLSSFQWSGDYAGFAQIEIERAHPGSIALFWAGCGGDQNPLPRRKVELARQYGKQLGDAVSDVLKDKMHPIGAAFTTSYRQIDLALAQLPGREQLEQETQSKNKYLSARAKHLLKQIDAGKPLSQTCPYPIGVWRIGEQVTFVILGGEVVVDYALRLKRELGDDRVNYTNVWVAGYSNDVMAYIPSGRVLQEGGYEGGGAMIYYGLPTVWAPGVEEAVVREVHRQAKIKKNIPPR